MPFTLSHFTKPMSLFRPFIASGVIAMTVLLQGLPVQAADDVDDAGKYLSGDWEGNFINMGGRYFTMSIAVTGKDGKVDGKASIPESSVDRSPTLTGTYSGAKVKIETSSGFTYDLTMTTNGSAYFLKGDASGANSGRIDLKKTGGDPYKAALPALEKAGGGKTCSECFIEKYAPAEFTKAFAVSKDGAYGARWKSGISMAEARDAALASCRKKPNYREENPCFVFFENDQLVWKP